MREDPIQSLNRPITFPLRLIGSISLVAILSNCVVAYKTSDLRSSLSQGVASINQNYQSIDADYSQKKSLFEQAIRDGGQPKASPYREMNILLQKMKRARAELARVQETLAKDQAAADALATTKERVRSDEPEYKIVTGIRDRWEDSRKRIQRIFSNYQAASQDLVKLASEKGFRQVESNQFRAQSVRLQADFRTSMTRIQSQIDAIQVKINEQSSEKKTVNQKLLNEIQTLTDSLKSKAPEIDLAINALVNSLPPDQKILVGPKSPYEGRVKRIENLVRAVNEIGDEIRKRGDALQR
jgi:hypothetical protein